MTDLSARPVSELSALLRSGELSAAELTSACLAAIAAREEQLRAWTCVDPEGALVRARELDALPPGERGPLHGVPVGVKDIIDTADLPTAYGSPIYAGHRPATDADVVQRLRAAGVVVLGKTVTTEFALFDPGPTVNPHDPARTPGGSSSGSAAAVGAGTVPLALGTQTAGSVIRPASFCGVVGIKPTYGAVPTAGVKECAGSLDTVGVFAGDVDGAARALDVMTGAPIRAGAGAASVASSAGLRVGFAPTAEWHRIAAPVRSRIEQAVERLAGDLDVTEVELPGPFVGLVEAQTCIMLVEISRALAVERAEHGDRLSDRLRDVLADGDRMAQGYAAAVAHVQRCRNLLGDAFASVDVLLTPSVLGEAPLLAEGTGDPVLCRGWTALGTPAVSVPGLTGPAGLPLGMQVVAPLGRDDLALAAARQVSALPAP